jgi:hypothetical protein
MTKLIDRIQQSLSKEGLTARTNASRRWLETQVQNLNARRSSLMNDRNRSTTTTIIGKMYFFYYSAKLKDSLPYYDRFPLVIPIEQYSDGFLGLNLHYIHPKQRIIFLDKLSEVISDKNYDENTKFMLSYKFLKASSKMYEKGPCIKRYYFNNIKSRFLEIKSSEWDIASFLPAENFSGANASKVWSESRKKF